MRVLMCGLPIYVNPHLTTSLMHKPPHHPPRSQVGTPFCITVDFDTLEDDTVTLRERDTTEQVNDPT